MLQEPSCVVEQALVSGSNPISDAQITASSEYNSNSAPRYARINNTVGVAWLCSSAEYTAPEPRMYIQVCLHVTTKCTCVPVIPTTITNY